MTKRLTSEEFTARTSMVGGGVDFLVEVINRLEDEIDILNQRVDQLSIILAENKKQP